ncbi:hypothetical protein HAV_00482 [Candidatus Hepatincola sp. Av]
MWQFVTNRVKVTLTIFIWLNKAIITILVLTIAYVCYHIAIKILAEFPNKLVWSSILNLVGIIVTIIAFIFKPSILQFICNLLFFLIGLKILCIYTIKQQKIIFSFTRNDICFENHNNHREHLAWIFSLYCFKDSKITIKNTPYTLITNKRFDNCKLNDELILRQWNNFIFYIGE